MSYAETTTKKFLDFNGLSYFAQKLNQYPTNDVIVAVVDGVQDALDEKVDLTQKGAASGVAELDASGYVPVAQLPDAVYDVLEFSAYSQFPVSGESGKLYVDTSSNGVYRWTGAAYTRINEQPTSISDAEIDALFA